MLVPLLVFKATDLRAAKLACLAFEKLLNIAYENFNDIASDDGTIGADEDLAAAAMTFSCVCLCCQAQLNSVTRVQERKQTYAWKKTRARFFCRRN
jgi:hypothetical protein